ncbi:cell division protein ZapA [Marinihelvus fidelis]|uniref:Cell division protein ZapA n=1 Tax=Marinihelvus fidelis TaxID=2613842 RepID=A0A5N0T9J8_9GAMM|nr:cell division protein ZapA [Marinihelvus fidelis]KAA9130807.1 cell division protein ZapA [Marinihelvus fidelis]
MSTEKEPISVTILDREYQFACLPEERAALKEAAELLDGRMREIKATGNLMALERIAVMTALNMSNELIELRKVGVAREEQVDRRIRMLADELEGALGDPID